MMNIHTSTKSVVAQFVAYGRWKLGKVNLILFPLSAVIIHVQLYVSLCPELPYPGDVRAPVEPFSGPPQPEKQLK